MQLKKNVTGTPVRTGRTFHINNNPISKKSLQQYVDDGTITEDDRELIDKYITEKKSSRELSPGRVNKIVFSLLAWRKVAPSFREATIGDIYKGIERLKAPDANKRKPASWKKDDSSEEIVGKPFKQNTIHDIIVIIKPFYKWLIEEGISTISEKKLKDIKRPAIDTDTKQASDLLTADERERMIRACTTSRDRAMLMMLYEGGFRIGEIGELKWSKVTFADPVVKVECKFKTGKKRNIALLASREYLAQWKADYPFDPAAEDALVFVTNRGEPATYQSLAKQIKRIAVKAGIERNITPHIFRHTRITDLIKERFSESIVKKMMWGHVNTDMFETYLHLAGIDTEEAVMEHYGVKQEKKGKSLEPRQCSRCYTVNSPYTKFCPQCGMELTTEAIKEKGDLERAIEIKTSNLTKEDSEEIAQRVADIIMERQKQAKANS